MDLGERLQCTPEVSEMTSCSNHTGEGHNSAFMLQRISSHAEFPLEGSRHACSLDTCNGLLAAGGKNGQVAVFATDGMEV